MTIGTKFSYNQSSTNRAQVVNIKGNVVTIKEIRSEYASNTTEPKKGTRTISLKRLDYLIYG